MNCNSCVVCLAAICTALTFAACDSQSFQVTKGAGKKSQRLGTTWTEWGSNQVVENPPGTNGINHGDAIYDSTHTDGFNTKSFESFSKYADAAWFGTSTSLPDVSGRIASAWTTDPNGCEMIVYRDADTGTMFWGLEGFVEGSCVAAPTFPATTVSGSIDGAPALASFEVLGIHGQIQNYYAFSSRSSDGALLYSHFANTNPSSGTWSTWAAKTDLVLRAGASPAAIAANPADTRVDIFALDAETPPQLYWRTLTGNTTWTSWTRIPNNLPNTYTINFTSDPSVGSIGLGRFGKPLLAVCLTGSDGLNGTSNVYCKNFDGTNWDIDFRVCGQPPAGQHPGSGPAGTWIAPIARHTIAPALASAGRAC